MNKKSASFLEANAPELIEAVEALEFLTLSGFNSEHVKEAETLRVLILSLIDKKEYGQAIELIPEVEKLGNLIFLDYNEEQSAKGGPI